MAAARQTLSLARIATRFARSPAAMMRLCRGLFLACFAVGLVGLPVGLMSGSATESADPQTVVAAGCRCSPVAQRAGQCCCFKGQIGPQKASSCCSTKSASAVKSCAASVGKKNASHALKVRPTSKSDRMIVVKEDCGCGPDPSVMLLITEPRLLADGPLLITSIELIERLLPASDSACGQRELPIVPPPESFLV